MILGGAVENNKVNLLAIIGIFVLIYFSTRSQAQVPAEGSLKNTACVTKAANEAGPSKIFSVFDDFK